MAQFPGTYTVWAQAGPASGFTTVEVESRQVVQRLEVLGQGRVSHRRTSDFWVFEGVDGRDYAVTGPGAPTASPTSGTSPTPRTTSWWTPSRWTPGR
jgi:hypothetical protein